MPSFTTDFTTSDKLNTTAHKLMRLGNTANNLLFPTKPYYNYTKYSAIKQVTHRNYNTSHKNC